MGPGAESLLEAMTEGPQGWKGAGDRLGWAGWEGFPDEKGHRVLTLSDCAIDQDNNTLAVLSVRSPR